MTEEGTVALAIYEAMAEQEANGATMSLQFGKIWVEGEAAFDLHLIAKATIAALDKHRAEKRAASIAKAKSDYEHRMPSYPFPDGLDGAQPSGLPET